MCKVAGKNRVFLCLILTAGLLLGLGLFVTTGETHAQVRMPIAGDTKRGMSKLAKVPPPYQRLSQLQDIPERKAPLTGTWNILVILIDFPDYTWDTQQDSNFTNPINQPGFENLYTTAYYREMLFSERTFKDPFSSNAYTGSMRDYFRENSYGQFDVQGTVTRWYRAAHEYRYYCNYDGIANTYDDYGLGVGEHSALTLVREAIQMADEDLDLSLFDNDKDGVVDALFVVHAGPGAEKIYTQNYPDHFNYIWSHQSSLVYDSMDGVRVKRYTVQPQDGTIGVFCHEFGHVLGLPDLYDTDRSSEGIGEWGLMGGGGWCAAPGDRLGTRPVHFTAWSKWKLGWLFPLSVTADQLQIQLPPIEKEPVALMVHNPSVKPGGQETSEFFLLENRQPIGFDRGLTRRQVELGKPQPAGLIIYHINNLRGGNQDEEHKLVDVEEASPVWVGGDWYENLDHPRDLNLYQYLYSGNRGDNGDPFPGYRAWNIDTTDFIGPRLKREFSDTTHPAAHLDDGTPSGIRITNIEIVGEDVRLDILFDPQSAVAEARAQVTGPEHWHLGVYPNPVRDGAAFRVGGAAPGILQNATLVVYDLHGRVVWQTDLRGRSAVFWNASPAAGVYFAVFRARGARVMTKLLVIR